MCFHGIRFKSNMDVYDTPSCETGSIYFTSARRNVLLIISERTYHEH